VPGQVKIDLAIMVVAHTALMAGRRPVNGPDKTSRVINGFPYHTYPA